MSSAVLWRLQHKPVSGYSLPTPDLRTWTYRVVTLLRGLLAEVWNAVAAQKELKGSPFPVPPTPHASSAPTAREVDEKPGSWRQGKEPEAEAQGRVTTTTLHLALSVALLHHFHLEPQYYCWILFAKISTDGKETVSLCKWKVGCSTLGKLILQHYTISKVAIINFLILTTLSNLMYHLSIYLLFSYIVPTQNY